MHGSGLEIWRQVEHATLLKMIVLTGLPPGGRAHYFRISRSENGSVTMGEQ